MKKIAFLFAALLPVLHRRGEAQSAERPPILGIAGVTILVSDVAEARKFYLKLIDPDHPANIASETLPFVFLPYGQRIQFEKCPFLFPRTSWPKYRFSPNDLEGFKRYFNFNKVDFDKVEKKHGGELIRLLLTDAEGHRISITDAYHLANSEDLNAGLPPSNLSNPVRIIHAGFVVKNRESADRYFVNELGFRPYWHGGMTEERDDWVAMQVPEGTDWVEYMLNISPDRRQAHSRRHEPHLSRRSRYSRHRRPGHESWHQTFRASQDWPRRQMAAQHLRCRRHPCRIHGIQARRKTLLLGIHRPASRTKAVMQSHHI